MQSDETLDELVYELQILRGFAENIQERIGLINATITELQLAISTLEGMNSEATGSSMLVPIGGGSYVRAKLEDSERLIVGVGADVAVEKTVGETKADFQSRILEFEKARTALQQQLDEASTKIDAVQREAQRVVQQLRGEVKDVRGP